MSADLTPVERAAVALLEQQAELDLLAEHIDEKRTMVRESLDAIRPIIRLELCALAAPAAGSTITGSTDPAPVVPVAGEQLPPAASPAPSPGQKRTTAARTAPRRKSTHAEVATVARQALADGTPMARAVAAHFDINEPAAQKRIQAARKAGHHIEAAKPATAVDVVVDHAPPVVTLATARPTYALMCDSCDFEVDAEHMSDLTRHCLSEHGRRPSPQERTPVPARGGAA